MKCENDECDRFVCRLVSKIDCYHYFHLFSNGVCLFCEKPDECIEFGAVSFKFLDIYQSVCSFLVVKKTEIIFQLTSETLVLVLKFKISLN